MGHLSGYLPIALVLGLAGGLSAAIYVLATYLGPKRHSPVKAEPFECGSESLGNARERFSVKFYLVALLFIVFDLEAVFVYPWAVLVRELGWFAFWEMVLFLATVVVGLVYIWKKGALEWTR
jgi:NADH-quinone oxidoreductase subunit A